MTLNGTKYTYETNAQGDIVGLLDSSNNEVLTYNYCPSTCRSMCLGKLISIGGTLASTVGAENPMRYRGYYYDTETGLYYLQSRYYNPDWGRFISQDEAQYHEGMTGAAANLYAYGANNPVMMSDPTGHSTIDTVLNILSFIMIFVTFVIPAKVPVIIFNLSVGAWYFGWSIYYLYYDSSHYSGKTRNIHLAIDSISLIMSILNIVAGCIGINMRILKSLGLVCEGTVLSITCDFLSGMFGLPWSAASAGCAAANFNF